MRNGLVRAADHGLGDRPLDRLRPPHSQRHAMPLPLTVRSKLVGRSASGDKSELPEALVHRPGFGRAVPADCDLSPFPACRHAAGQAGQVGALAVEIAAGRALPCRPPDR